VSTARTDVLEGDFGIAGTLTLLHRAPQFLVLVLITTLTSRLYQQHHYGLQSDQITEFPPHSIAALQSITESWKRVVTPPPNSCREQFGTGMRWDAGNGPNCCTGTVVVAHKTRYLFGEVVARKPGEFVFLTLYSYGPIVQASLVRG
jgi:hypothetical protein